MSSYSCVPILSLNAKENLLQLCFGFAGMVEFLNHVSFLAIETVIEDGIRNQSFFLKPLIFLTC